MRRFLNVIGFVTTLALFPNIVFSQDQCTPGVEKYHMAIETPDAYFDEIDAACESAKSHLGKGPDVIFLNSVASQGRAIAYGLFSV